MKKKITAIVLTSAMVISLLSGCGKKDEPAPTPGNETVSEETQTETEETETEEPAEEEQEVAERPTHYDILPEVANASIADGAVFQVGDIVLKEGCQMSVEDVKAAVSGSQTGVYCEDTVNSYDEDVVVIYDPYGLDTTGVDFTWTYIDPNEDGALPVPEAGYYVSDILVNENILEELWGITDSVYMGGGYTMSNAIIGEVKDSTKTHDDFIAELEALGLTKVDELPSSISVDEKGYYTDKETLVEYLVNDNYWTGKTTNSGSVIDFPYIGESYFKNDDGTLSSFSNTACTTLASGFEN